jgi:hypothetical protein
MIGEAANDGSGTQNQTGNLDFNYQIARFLHAYVEEYFGSHMTPGWRYIASRFLASDSKRDYVYALSVAMGASHS